MAKSYSDTSVVQGAGRNPKSDGDTEDVLSALGVELKPKMYTKGELVGLKSSVKAF